ncbi:hypothetical protein PC121_g3494 [Phytophthora cactorum]|nr:hypothetical protein PC120_g1756 [Phytophthora cactorum]KAG3092744.1 hypothetical protein PC121_g3494 [Phytophthora cactorum]
MKAALVARPPLRRHLTLAILLTLGVRQDLWDRRPVSQLLVTYSVSYLMLSMGTYELRSVKSDITLAVGGYSAVSVNTTG